ncbi:MAG: class I SAM-dependent methyltransferase [Acidobacteriota bacterium]|jgi:ubiquinone/menaquinone biosynthesis C-methylase UbiE
MKTRFGWLRRVALAAVLLLAAALLTIAPDLAKMDLGSLSSREGWQLPDRVIESLRIQSGEHVADVGAGDGYFTFRLAAAVGPSGRVYAVEVDDERVAELERRAREGSHDNVVVVRGEYADPLLPDGEIDLVLFCNSYHHIEDRVAYLDRLRSDLADEARVAVIDLKGSLLVRLLAPPGHWTTVETMTQEMEGASYVLAESFDYLPAQSFVVFRPGPR